MLQVLLSCLSAVKGTGEAKLCTDRSGGLPPFLLGNGFLFLGECWAQLFPNTSFRTLIIPFPFRKNCLLCMKSSPPAKKKKRWLIHYFGSEFVWYSFQMITKINRHSEEVTESLALESIFQRGYKLTLFCGLCKVTSEGTKISEVWHFLWPWHLQIMHIPFYLRYWKGPCALTLGYWRSYHKGFPFYVTTSLLYAFITPQTSAWENNSQLQYYIYYYDYFITALYSITLYSLWAWGYPGSPLNSCCLTQYLPRRRHLTNVCWVNALIS